MTNNESLYTPTVTASGNLSHKTCSHPANARFRARCRYESAAARFAETAALREARPAYVAPAGPIVITNMN